MPSGPPSRSRDASSGACEYFPASRCTLRSPTSRSRPASWVQPSTSSRFSGGARVDVAAGDGAVWHRGEADVLPVGAVTMPAEAPHKGWASAFSLPANQLPACRRCRRSPALRPSTVVSAHGDPTTLLPGHRSSRCPSRALPPGRPPETVSAFFAGNKPWRGPGAGTPRQRSGKDLRCPGTERRIFWQEPRGSSSVLAAGADGRTRELWVNVW